MPPTLLSPAPITEDYVQALRADLDGAKVLRFVMAYVTTSGLDALGVDRLAAALRGDQSLGVASLACACGFDPLLQLQERVGREPANLRYFLDPGIADATDPNVSLLHSKLVYVVRADGRAVVYLGSHNWSGRALGGGTTRNAEASFRLELDFEDEHLLGHGTGLGAEVNRHILACYNLGACLGAHPDNRPIFEDWFRVRCKRPADLDLDAYAVLVGICGESVKQAADPKFWAAEAGRGASIYLQCHEEYEGQVVRKRQERVLAMIWAGQDAFAKARPPVLLFCKVTRQVAGEESTYEGTSQGDITNFRFLLWDPQQDASRGTGNDAGPRLRATTRTGTEFDYFVLDDAPIGASASAFDGAAPRYQHYLQVYEVVVPAWMMIDLSASAAGEERAPLAWSPEEFALSPTRQVPPEEQRQYRAPEDTAGEIMACLREMFGVDIDQAVALPTSAETDPRKLVRLVTSTIHEACIDEATEALQGAFYARATPGGIAMRLADTAVGRTNDPESTGPVQRVQELFGERLRNLLVRLGVAQPDVAEWESKPVARRTEETAKRPKKLVQDQVEVLSKPGAAKPAEPGLTTLRPPSQAEIAGAVQKAIRDVVAGGVAGRSRDDTRAAIIDRACTILGHSVTDAALRAAVQALLLKSEAARR